MQAFLIYVVLVVSHKVLRAELSSINFLLNGGYYADYASIMGMMGLPVMHHTTWDNLVAWVGTHVEQLAEWYVTKLEQTLISVVMDCQF